MLNHLRRRRFSPEEYLLLEERSEFRSEYFDGEIYAMTGGSLDHNRILQNLVAELRDPARARGCEVFASDVRLLVESFTLFTYPDIMVVCGKPPLMAGRTDTVTDAAMIVEILSPSTEAYDRGEKFRFYRSLPSLQEYLTVFQSEVRVEHHRRQGPATWLMTEVASKEASLELPWLQAVIPLERLCVGVEVGRAG